MRLLIDTHIFLWLVSDSRELKPQTRQWLVEADAVYVSAASIWEIAIKVALKKLKADPAELVDAMVKTGLKELPITAKHAAMLATLPQFPDHNDPFDRLLVAQALTEPLLLVTNDKQLVRYGNLVRLT